MMRVKDITFAEPADNLLFDDVLLAQAEPGGGVSAGVLRFWESAVPFIVLGRSGAAERELRLDAVRASGIPVLRRMSGGGTVVQGRGCLNYALVLPKVLDRQLEDVRGSYRWISEKILAVLRGTGVEAVFQPISDLALADGNRKFSGNAQRRTRSFILHHGTLLYDYDLGRIEQLLAMPVEVPPYRQGRGHLEFVTNIGLDPEAFKRGLIRIFGAGEPERVLSTQEAEGLAAFRRDRPVPVEFNGMNRSGSGAAGGELPLETT
jgi:lipoate-protein ligase A